jgi:Lecithin retinol acyltransferase
MIGSELHLMAKEPPLGSHVVTPRRGYLHHGIYVGEGRVVHYSGLSRGLHRGPVEETSLLRFTRGRPVWVQLNAPSLFDSREIVRRARSRVGEDFYRLLSNNCEHFCEWCLRGENRSYQVEAWAMQPGRALKATLRLLARPLSAARHFVPQLCSTNAG